MNTDDKHDFLSPRRGPAPLTPSELAEQLATDYPQLCIHPDAPLIGGMGAVYSATLTSGEDSHHVAIKVLHWHLMDDPAFTARFQREQALLHQLDHRHIVKLRDIGHTAEGLPFLVMDWVAGRSLTEFTQRGSTTDRQQLLQIADDLCAAAQHAHEKGILHRDLKPQNIIVTPDGRAIVLDFGIARSLRSGHTLTQPGDAPGTHGYIAPEVLAGEKPDARADIFSLGIIIYQLLMKKLPDVFAAHPSEHSLDPRFDEIVIKAAAAEREKRYASAEALRVALESIRQNSKTEAQTMNNGITPTRPDPKSIVIEYDDDWITIKRQLPDGRWRERVFSSEPFVADVIELLGQPDKIVANEMKTTDGKPLSVSFHWYSLGVSVGSYVPDSAFNPKGEPSLDDRTRHQRARFLNVATTEQSLFKEHVSEWQPFSGVIRICGITCDQRLSIASLLATKRGSPFKVSQSKSTLVSVEADKKVGVVIVITASSHDSQVESVSLGFERWCQPSDDLSALPLAPGETVIDSLSGSRYRGNSFALMLTTRRLFAVTDRYAKPFEILLSDEPHIVEEGWHTATRIYDYVRIEVAVVLVLLGVYAPIDSAFKLGTLITKVGEPNAGLPTAFLICTSILALLGIAKLLARYERKEPHDDAKYLRRFRLSARTREDVFFYRGGVGQDAKALLLIRDRAFISRLRATVSLYAPHEGGSISAIRPRQDFQAIAQKNHPDFSLDGSQPGTSLPWYFVTMNCGCRVHPFAAKCSGNTTHNCGGNNPNITPKLWRWTAQGVGLLGGYGFLFGGHDNRELSLLAIGVFVISIGGLKIATALFRVDHQ